MSDKLKVAIIGPGNIGTDLMMKVMQNAQHLEMGAMAGVDPRSEGLARAAKAGVATTAEGIDGLVALPVFKDIDIVFDATSANAHPHHNAVLQQYGIQVIDLTPAAIGPYVVPAINLDEVEASNINMVTCGGQATIPIVAAVAQVTPVYYAEIVASIASLSAGPGTRANIDEFTETTRNALEKVGGAKQAKAIIILNPAEPPIMMRDTVYLLTAATDRQTITDSIAKMVAKVQQYVPGYRLKQQVQFDEMDAEQLALTPAAQLQKGLRVTVLIEVEGAAHFLPSWAGNLDIMTSAALACADHLADRRLKAGTARRFEGTPS